MTRLARQEGLTLILCLLAGWILTFCCRTSPEEDDEENDVLNWISCEGRGVDTTAYYVSPSGDDNADGKGDVTAFRTIARALQAIHPGGAIRILPGTYSEAIGILNCGSAATTITIAGHDGIPVIDGQNRGVMGFFCENCTNLVFSDLQIQNYTDIGIGATQSNGITIQNLIVKDNGHAVQLEDWGLEGYGIHVENSANVTIENNDVSRNGPQPQIFPGRLMGTGINTYGNQNVVIRNNRSYENIGGGILVEDSFNVLVENNEAYSNDLDASADEWWDGGLWIDGGHDVMVRNNLFRDNLGPGIEISDEDLQNPYGYILENNVSTRNYYGIFIWNFGTSDWPDSTIVRRSGNQFTGNTRQDVWIVDRF